MNLLNHLHFKSLKTVLQSSLSSFLFSAFYALLPTVSLAGGDGSLIQNGGDLLYCAPSPNSEFSGYYTLDYILDYRTTGEHSALAKIDSWQASQKRILENLKRVAPPLAQSFERFTETLYGEDSLRRWTKADLSSVIINDEEITKQLPQNCYQNEGVETIPNLHQTVVRRYLPEKIEYLYEENLLKPLEVDDPLQFSFFIVHEWIWDLTQNSRELRRLNWFLHSASFDTTTEGEFARFLKRGSFFNRYLPVCMRSSEVKIQIETSLKTDCQEITEVSLSALQTLNLSTLSDADVIRVGDFSRLFGLQFLDLSGLGRSILSLPPYLFVDLIELKVLKVSTELNKEEKKAVEQWFTGAKVISD